MAAATAQGEASREKILSTAIALFSERGYAGTSVAEVCERAGVVKTAVSVPAGNLSRSRPAQPRPFQSYDPGPSRRPDVDAAGPAPSLRSASARDSSG